MEIIIFFLLFFMSLVIAIFTNIMYIKNNNHLNTQEIFFEKIFFLLLLSSFIYHVFVLLCYLFQFNFILVNNITDILLVVLGHASALYVFFKYKANKDIHGEINADINYENDHLTVLVNPDNDVLKAKVFLYSLEKVKKNKYKSIDNYPIDKLRKIISNSEIIINFNTDEDVSFLMLIASSFYIPYILENIFDLGSTAGSNDAPTITILKIAFYSLITIGLIIYFFNRRKNNMMRNKNLSELIYYCKEEIIRQEKETK